MYRNILLLLCLNLFLCSCLSLKDRSLIIQNKEIDRDEAFLQSNEVISSLANASRKIHDIAWKIMRENRDFCDNAKINAFGIMVSSSLELDAKMRKSFFAAAPDYNNERKMKDDFAMIVSVAKDSPAYRAGIYEGDIIVAINNENYSSSNYKNSLRIAAENSNLKLSILRNSSEYNFNLNSEVICGYPVQPMISPIPNAYADGSKIFITIATLDFIKDDQELAFLIGHELAHNIVHYEGKGLPEVDGLPLPLDDTPSIRNISDVFIFHSGAKEIEADMLGVEYVLRAGFKQDKAANYFRRLSIYMPILMNDSFFRVHPGNVKRASKIDEKVKSYK